MVKKVLKNTLVKCTAFFSAFLGNYRGRFAPKVGVFVLSEKPQKSRLVKQTECGSWRAFSRCKDFLFYGDLAVEASALLLFVSSVVLFLFLLV